MGDENVATREIPAQDDDVHAEGTAIDRDGDPRAGLPLGAALSVLWWVEGEPTSPR